MKRLKLIALGGNEVSPVGNINPSTGKLTIPDISEQWHRTAETCKIMAKIIKQNPKDYFVITHGNGPQIGDLILNSTKRSTTRNNIPLDICDADTQGSIGYMLAQLTNALQIIGINKLAAETVTRVVVDINDKAFNKPTKFIGRAYNKEEVLEQNKNKSQNFKVYKKDDKGNELWRWVVPSPVPIDIIEFAIIESNLVNGIIPIAVGGGGIPVVEVKPEIKDGNEIYKSDYGFIYKRKFYNNSEPAKIYKGVEAVVDKDLATALLGIKLINSAKLRDEKLEAELIILTNVDCVKLHYQQKDQTDLKFLSLKQVKELYGKGEFPDGSMGPKIKASINFLENGGQRVFITKSELLEQTLQGLSGTRIE